MWPDFLVLHKTSLSRTAVKHILSTTAVNTAGLHPGLWDPKTKNPGSKSVAEIKVVERAELKLYISVYWRLICYS
jgi:hypothetical protein